MAELERADTLEGINDAIFTLRAHYGVENMVYHWVDSAGEQYGYGTYSLDWAARYQEQNYIRIDPVDHYHHHKYSISSHHYLTTASTKIIQHL